MLVRPSISGVHHGVWDIRWDDPSLLARNAAWTVVGVNIYRSDVSDLGPFYRINEFPVGGGFFRDITKNVRTIETVDWNTGWLSKGDSPNDRRWVIKTTNPIVKENSEPPFDRPIPANLPSDVHVYIDGVEAGVDNVFGPSGEVKLIDQETFDTITEKIIPPVLPTTATSVVEIVYFRNINHIQTGLESGVFYRLTTVVIDATKPSGYNETDLDWCKPAVANVVEELDYIWREAVRRNQWILQQGGERVKIFIRRQSGIPCDCGLDPRQLEYSGQPSNRCQKCYGTSFVGGFEGPYEALIAPDDAERKISQQPTGRRQEHMYEVFMGPSPMVSMRDFIVKQNNDRYTIGAVRRPTNRGNLLQQHFSINSMDGQDIRFMVPIDGVDTLVFPQTRYGRRQVPAMPVDGELRMSPSTQPDKPAYPLGPDAQTPMQTDKQPWAEGTQQRGRTPSWENSTE